VASGAIALDIAQFNARVCALLSATPTLMKRVTVGLRAHKKESAPPWALRHCYQRVTLSEGARYSFCPGLTLKASYHESILRTVATR
jgi:hypothetical protein